MSNNPIRFTEHFRRLTQDAVLWKAHRLWQKATEPDDQAAAMEQLAEMLVCIQNDTKRAAYIEKLCDSINEKATETRQKVEAESQHLISVQKQADRLENRKTRSDKDDATLAHLKKEVADITIRIAKLKAGRMASIQPTVLKKVIGETQRRRKAELERKKTAAQLEKKVQSAEDAGLPTDFEGDKKDVFDAIEYGIFVHKGKYWSKQSGSPISNFTMKIIYHTDTGDDKAFRVISLKNVYGREKVISLNTDDFVSLGSFKKIIARKGDFVFKGNDGDLARLQEYLQRDEVSSKFVETLGYNRRGGFWAWGNGITPLKTREASIDFIPVDEHGIVQYGEKHYFIPALSQMYADKDNLFVSEKRFIYREAPKDLGFEKWNDLMLKAYKPEKAIPAILHYLGCLFRDIIMNKFQRYPILNLFGPPQAGKGKMAESLMSMFGFRQTQIMLGGAATAVGFMRKFAQLRNAYVWLDEYKNTLPFKILESIKNIYDGIGYERGKMTNDLQTESTEVNSSCILSGQEMPIGEAALFTRIILISFDDGKNRSYEQKQAFDTLKDIENDGGLSFITAEILQYRKLVEDQFETHFKQLQYDLSRRLGASVIDDRFIDNISMLLACRKVFDGILPFGFTYEEAEEVMILNIRAHQKLKQSNNDISKFWEVLEFLVHRGDIREGREFILEGGYIYLRLKTVHGLYMKELRQRGDMQSLDKATLEHYLRMDKASYVDYKQKKGFEDGQPAWCFLFRYNILGVDLLKMHKGDHESAEMFQQRLDSKAREMGCAPVAEDDDDVPFPIQKN